MAEKKPVKAKKGPLSLEEKAYIEESLEKGRNIQQMAIVLNRSEEVVEKFCKELYPAMFQEEEEEVGKRPKSLFHQMMTSREGMAIMGAAASEVSDDLLARAPHRVTSRMAKNAIHKPLGGKKD